MVFCEVCGKRIFRRTKVCPHCKTPVADNLYGQKPQGLRKKRKGSKWKRFCIFLLFITAFIMACDTLHRPDIQPNEEWFLGIKGSAGELKGSLEIKNNQLPPETVARVHEQAALSSYVGTYTGCFMTEYTGMDVLYELLEKFGPENEEEKSTIYNILSISGTPYPVTAEFDGQTLTVWSHECPITDESGEIQSIRVKEPENGIYRDEDDDTDEELRMSMTTDVCFLKDGSIYVLVYHKLNVFGFAPVDMALRIKLNRSIPE